MSTEELQGRTHWCNMLPNSQLNVLYSDFQSQDQLDKYLERQELECFRLSGIKPPLQLPPSWLPSWLPVRLPTLTLPSMIPDVDSFEDLVSFHFPIFPRNNFNLIEFLTACAW